MAERGNNFIERGAGSALRIVRGLVRGGKRGQWCGFGDGETTIYFPPPGTNRHAGIINANLNHPPCVSYGRSSLSSSFINHLRRSCFAGPIPSLSAIVRFYYFSSENVSRRPYISVSNDFELHHSERNVTSHQSRLFGRINDSSNFYDYDRAI